MAIDILTGKFFIPQFVGQRTEAIDPATGEQVNSVEGIARVVDARWGQGQAMQAPEGGYDTWDWPGGVQEVREKAEGYRPDITLDDGTLQKGQAGVDVTRDVWFVNNQRMTNAELAGLKKRAESQLVGGGTNQFIRSAAGLGTWVSSAGTTVPEITTGQSTVTVDPDIVAGVAGGFGGTGGETTVVPEGPWAPAGDTRHTYDAQGKLLPSASMGDFIAALGAIGIDQAFAEELWQWGMDKLLDYDYPMANLIIDVYDTDAFKQRFPAIEAMRKMENVKPPTPAEYIQYETDVSELMATYGVQGQEMDFDTLVTNLMVNNVGTQEVQQRLVAANRILGNVPDEITETYMDWYGPEVAEANLMKTFLDPDDEWGGTWAEVSAETRTAEIGGWARTRLGLGRSSNVSKALAGQVAEIGYTQGEIWTKLDTLSQNESLFYEKVTEGRDLDIKEEGIMGAFDLGTTGLSMGEWQQLPDDVKRWYPQPEDMEDIIAKRKQTRLAGMSGGGGAMLAGTQTGFGAANA